MRVASFLLVAVIVFAPLEGRTSPPPPSHVDRLVALCRLWNAVRFFDPDLTGEADSRWDDALIAALPHVDEPDGLRIAAQTMLAALHDPLSTVEGGSNADGSVALPSARDDGTLRYVSLNGYPSADGLPLYRDTLRSALLATGSTRTLVVDLRTSAPASDAQYSREMQAWATSAAVLSSSLLQLPRAAHREYLGFPSEDSESFYTSSLTSDDGEVRSVPGAATRNVRVAFIVDRTALLPNEAVALLQHGDAALFSSDGTADPTVGAVREIEAGAGLTAQIRYSAPLGFAPPHPGALAEAVAWASSSTQQRDTPPPGSVPIATRYHDAALPDAPHRVLAAYRIWGTIAYLSPYLGLSEDWDGALKAGLNQFEAALTPMDYTLAIARMYAHIHDSHGRIQAPAFAAAFGGTPPFIARDLGGRMTIVRADARSAAAAGIAVGDVIETIDGKPVSARRRHLLPYIVASTPQAAEFSLESAIQTPSLFAGPLGSTARLVIQRADGSYRSVSISRVGAEYQLFVRTRPVISILAGNVGYIDLARLNLGQIDEALKTLARTRALVFDLRGYPRGVMFSLAPHFTRETTSAALFHTPVLREPRDQEGDELLSDEVRPFYQLVRPQSPYYSRPVIVLIDCSAISQAEHTALFLEATAHPVFVGEPTNGADGDVTTFIVPGNVRLSFSGQAVLHADGRRLQRVGIVPKVRVAPSTSGIRARLDEILSAGLREALVQSGADGAQVQVAVNQERAAERADASSHDRVPDATAVAVAGADASFLPLDAMRAANADYEGARDPTMRHASGRTIVLRAHADAPESGFGYYAESIPAADYRGKRVRISGYLRSREAQQASFWMRVDGPAGTGSEAFDNMANRSLYGTQEWTPFSIVLDVPTNASNILTGLLLLGRGTVWADDVRIDVVDVRTPTTGM